MNVYKNVCVGKLNDVVPDQGIPCNNYIHGRILFMLASSDALVAFLNIDICHQQISKIRKKTLKRRGKHVLQADLLLERPSP